jgi:transposase-like protein
MKLNTNPFKWRHFEPEIILLCVRWYCRYQLSYRDLAEMMSERGLSVRLRHSSDGCKPSHHRSISESDLI